MKRIYLDHAATTPLHPVALQAMEPWLREGFGNPSSLHAEGRRAKDALDRSREILSQALGCLFAEVVFTSSGTEAAQLAIVGAALGNKDASRDRVLLGAAEHHGVLETQVILKRLGYQVELVPVDRQGRVCMEALGSNLGEDVLLVSIMAANNELGTLNPIPEIAHLGHSHGALVHTDAVQAFLTEPNPQGVDLLSIAAHKVSGPKGVGVLYIRAGTPIEAVTLGGGQERELRAGTENVPGIVGFGAAVEWRLQYLGDKQEPRDAFLKKLSEQSTPDWLLTSPVEKILPGHAHLRFPGIGAESMLIKLDRLGVSASSGAACSSGSIQPSHVMLACGYTEAEAREGLRFSFGIETTTTEAEEAAKRVARAANQIAESRHA